MVATKKKSEQIWKLTEGQKSHLTHMLKNAGFKSPVVINKMINRICTSKTTTAQAIMTRWLENRTENGMKVWMNDFLYNFRSSGIKREDLIEILSANPMMFFSKVETLREHGQEFQNELKGLGIILSDKVAFNKMMFKSGIFARSPSTVAKNIKDLISVFEKRGVALDAEYFVSRVLKERAQMFMQKPETLAFNMDETVQRLQKAGYPITIRQYAKACSSQLSLSYRTPESICENFEKIYAFIEHEHCRLAQDVRKDVKTSEAIVQKILADPAQLSSGDDVLNTRWLLACQMQDEKGMAPTYTQIVKVRSKELNARLDAYRCPLQRMLDKLHQRN